MPQVSEHHSNPSAAVMVILLTLSFALLLSSRILCLLRTAVRREVRMTEVACHDLDFLRLSTLLRTCSHFSIRLGATTLVPGNVRNFCLETRSALTGSQLPSRAFTQRCWFSREFTYSSKATLPKRKTRTVQISGRTSRGSSNTRRLCTQEEGQWSTAYLGFCMPNSAVQRLSWALQT